MAFNLENRPPSQILMKYKIKKETILNLITTVNDLKVLEMVYS